MLYNHCSPLETPHRWIAGTTLATRFPIGCPRAIHDYFFGARSVDVSNQLHYSYLIGRKSKKAWPRLAWWLLDMCIVNAFQLWSIGKDASAAARFPRTAHARPGEAVRIQSGGSAGKQRSQRFCCTGPGALH